MAFIGCREEDDRGETNPVAQGGYHSLENCVDIAFGSLQFYASVNTEYPPD